MASNKNEFPDRDQIRADVILPESELELERRAADGSGRDPTARRGEIEEGGSISDADVGEDQIFEKAIGGYGADSPNTATTHPPHGDNTRMRGGGIEKP